MHSQLKYSLIMKLLQLTVVCDLLQRLVLSSGVSVASVLLLLPITWWCYRRSRRNPSQVGIGAPIVSLPKVANENDSFAIHCSQSGSKLTEHFTHIPVLQTSSTIFSTCWPWSIVIWAQHKQISCLLSETGPIFGIQMCHFYCHLHCGSWQAHQPGHRITVTES